MMRNVVSAVAVGLAMTLCVPGAVAVAEDGRVIAGATVDKTPNNSIDNRPISLTVKKTGHNSSITPSTPTTVVTTSPTVTTTSPTIPPTNTLPSTTEKIPLYPGGPTVVTGGVAIPSLTGEGNMSLLTMMVLLALIFAAGYGVVYGVASRIVVSRLSSRDSSSHLKAGTSAPQSR